MPGHKSQRITTHYSAAELSNLIAAANKVHVKRNSSILASVTGVNSNLNRAVSNTIESPRLAAKKASLFKILNCGQAVDLVKGRASDFALGERFSSLLIIGETSFSLTPTRRAS